MEITEVHSEQQQQREAYEFVVLPDQEKYFPNLLKKATTERFFRW